MKRKIKEFESAEGKKEKRTTEGGEKREEKRSVMKKK